VILPLTRGVDTASSVDLENLERDEEEEKVMDSGERPETCRETKK
jgi:hypothetical protein